MLLSANDAKQPTEQLVEQGIMGMPEILFLSFSLFLLIILVIQKRIILVMLLYLRARVEYLAEGGHIGEAETHAHQCQHTQH